MSLTTSNPTVSPPSTSDPPEGPQVRRKHPCVLCQQRKVKCDRNAPCANCLKARVECISPSTLPPRRRKKRFPEAELLARLRKYEEHLRKYGADIDAINNEPSPALSSTSPTVTSVTSLLDTTIITPTPSSVLSIRKALKKAGGSNVWDSVHQEFQDAEDLLQGSSEDEMYERPITKTYDSMFPDDIIFPSPAIDDIRDLHPSTVHIFRLWQTFLDSINPLLKIFHAPTVQQQILDATADLDNIPRNTEALMFGIYSTAIISFGEQECYSTFGESKSTLLTRFHAGARQAFHKAGLLRSSDLTLLQACVLYLISCLNFTVDPRSVYCLVGIAVRIAQRMGLNFDGTSYNLPPFEVEMRRRLWWQIILLDVRVSELSGAGHGVLNHTWSTKLPLNINDSDLYPGMQDPPTEHVGATEMVFVLQRCGILDLQAKFRFKPLPYSLQDEAINELEEKFQEKYFQHCDTSIPLHLIATLMAKLSIAKLHLGVRFRPVIADATNAIPTEESNYIFGLSVRCLETSNEMMASSDLERFQWFILTNFPFPAHVYLCCALRYRPTTELADRAWESIQWRVDRQSTWFQASEFWRKHADSAIYLAFVNLTLKAWEAREKAFPGIATPDFILHFREHLASKKPPKSTSSSAETEETPPSVPSTGTEDPTGVTYPWFNPSVGDVNQELDMISGIMPSDNQSIGWDFWNDLMQPTIPGYPHEGVPAGPLPGTYHG